MAGMSFIEGNLIGVKDVKEMIDVDLWELMRRVEELETATKEDEKKMNKGLARLMSRKSTASPISSIGSIGIIK